MPAGTISVARPSKWGNEFKIGKLTRSQAVENHRAGMIAALKRNSHYLAELRGKNLACYCDPAEECHADTLIALANAPVRS